MPINSPIFAPAIVLVLGIALTGWMMTAGTLGALALFTTFGDARIAFLARHHGHERHAAVHLGGAAEADADERRLHLRVAADRLVDLLEQLVDGAPGARRREAPPRGSGDRPRHGPPRVAGREVRGDASFERGHDLGYLATLLREQLEHKSE